MDTGGPSGTGGASDRTARLLSEAQQLNALSVRDSFPLPRVDDTAYSLGDAKLSSSIDVWQSFWQIPVSDEDIPKTDFTTHKGL